MTMTVPPIDQESLIMSAIREMRADVCAHLHKIQDDVTTLANNQKVLTDQVSANRSDTEELKAWRKTNSDRVKGLVAHDSQSDLTTASLQSKVDALTQTQELQLSILTRLDKVTSNPQVKIILAVMATAAMSWAASKGLK